MNAIRLIRMYLFPINIRKKWILLISCWNIGNGLVLSSFLMTVLPKHPASLEVQANTQLPASLQLSTPDHRIEGRDVSLSLP